MLIPRQTVPNLELPTLDHGPFTLANDQPKNFSLVVFFRGLHCPLCVKYLKDLGVFLIRPDQTLYYSAVQTMPFARPSFSDLMMAIDYAIDKDYPARGEYTGPV